MFNDELVFDAKSAPSAAHVPAPGTGSDCDVSSGTWTQQLGSTSPEFRQKRFQRPGRRLPVEQQSGHEVLAAASGVKQQSLALSS
jgi:hypothetical protein